MSSDASTPLMRQYHAIKQQVPDALLMFRLGDFYELFFEDAVTAARELEITLTVAQQGKGRAIPMCGVPYHAAEGYIARLIQKGYRVAICDQMEDPQPGQETGAGAKSPASSRPARPLDADLLRSHENNYLAAVARGGRARRAGATWIFPPANSASPRWIRRKCPARSSSWARAKCCAPGDLPLLPASGGGAALHAHRGRRLGFQPPITPSALLREHFKLLSLDGCGLATAARRWAPPAPFCTICATRSARRSIIWTGPRIYDRAESMVLDAVTVRNLELVEPLFAADAARRSEATLLGVLDQTRPAWAAGCCGSVCCGLRSTARKSRRGWTRWANCCARPSCAPNCASNSARCWISSGCWPR